MKLYEFEGKKIFAKVGIKVPNSFLISNPGQINKIPKSFYPALAKIQVLSGDRAVRGGILVCNNFKELQSKTKNLLGADFGGEQIQKVLVEQKIVVDKEYYFSVTYDTWHRAPVLLVSKKAGTGISAYDAKLVLNPGESFDREMGEKILQKANFPPYEVGWLSEILEKLVRLFYDFDCRLAEINPLARSAGQFFALDSKIILDDAGLFRHHQLKFPPRTASGAPPSKAEIAAAKIDENDHRGVAGSVYFDLAGDIGILASGGGGSLVGLDGVLKAAGKPANYTEYSGNPPAEKVYKLAKIVLGKKGLNGLLVAGAIANFTDIYETLRGFLEALREVRPKFPIVVRRAGPRDKEAFEMLRDVGKKEGFDIHLFGSETPIDSAAEVIVKLAKEYKTNVH